MATNIAEIRSEDIDSRTATFERKRPHDLAIQDDNSNAGSAQSTPRKRQKPAAKLGYQDVRDFVPKGASFSKNAPLNQDVHSGESEGSHEVAETSTATPMKWNAVNSTKIRTSLGGGLGKGRAVQEEGLQASQIFDGLGKGKTTQDEVEQTIQAVDGLGKVNVKLASAAPKTAREQATEVALARLESYRDRLAGMEPNDGPISAYKVAQAEVENAEIDYNYCLYYPLNLEFNPPPPKAYVPGKGKTTTTKERRYQIWRLTKDCMREGTLQDLRDGKLALSIETRVEQAFDVRQTWGKLRSLQETYASNTTTSGSSYERAKEEIRETQTDLNYCQFFPTNEDYLSLHRVKMGLDSPNDFIGGNGNLNRRAAQLWKLTQQCETDGTLENLRDGHLGQCIRNIPAATQAFLTSAQQAGENMDPLKPRSEDRAADELTVTNGSKGDVEFQDAAGPGRSKAAHRLAEVQENGEVTSSRRNMVELSPEPEEASRTSHNGSERDKDLVLNTYESDRLLYVEPRQLRETEEINQILDRADTNPADLNYGTASEGSDSTADAESDSENDDFIHHSDSEQAADEASREPELRTMSSRKNARTLTELSSQDLNAQLRYFHVAKTIDEVDRSTPVRCLVCSSQGHMAEVCDQLTCSVCGALNHHSTRNCPSTAKCSKCRELGHDKWHCPYKLKNIAQNEIVCDLCQRNGHIEEDCELQWRTSGRPWESNLRGRNIQLSCYECGRSGHLGNDCPTRRPGKSLGSSTWGSGDNQLSINSKGELSIKGRARHDPIDIDDGQKEMAGAFLRPRVPEPVRKGKIQIKTGLKPTSNDLGLNSGWNPINAPYNSGRANGLSYGGYRNDGRGDWQPANGAGQQELPDRPRYDSYGPINRRSHSPEYRNRGGYNHPDRYQPPAPRETYQRNRPPPRADVYRPMPSSAQNAWSKHRV